MTARKAARGMGLVPGLPEIENAFNQRACAAIKRARQISGLSAERFANRLSRLLEVGVTPAEVRLLEAGQVIACGGLTLAAATISGQPMDVCTGDRELYEIALPELEKQLSDLSAYVAGGFLERGSRKLRLLPRSKKDTG